MRIAFFGTPAFAVPSLKRLLADGHSVVLVVTQPDRRRGRGQRLRPSPVKTVAAEHGLPLLQPERAREPDFAGQFAGLAPDLGVVVAYGQILPEVVLEAPRLGVINVHASLLPLYRGAAPIQRAIIAGERETGVTMIRLVQEMDAGPMLATTHRQILEHETSEDVAVALSHAGADLLVDTVHTLADGRAREEKQDHVSATYAPRISREDGRIDWQRPADAIHNLVRGLVPWPHAFTFLNDRRYLIRRTTFDNTPSRSAVMPGDIVEASGDRLRVACGGGTVLSIHELQPEGRRSQAARAFLAGHSLVLPARFRGIPGEGPDTADD